MSAPETKFRVDLFRGPDYQPAGELPLRGVLDAALEAVAPGLPRTAETSFLFLLHREPRPARLHGAPTICNLMPDYGYATLIARDHDRVLYRHPHTIEELVARPLQTLLARQAPETSIWGFRIAGPGMPVSMVRPPPEVAGVAMVRPYAQGEKPAFRIRRIEEAPPPLISWSASAGAVRRAPEGTTRENPASVKVLLRDAVFRVLEQEQPFSTEVEEGGFLIGRVFRDRDVEGTYVADVMRLLPARHTGASFLHFTFTGDSFSEMKQTLARSGGDETLLGWYHTHLFAAREEMGLSSIDLTLHDTTFRQPWSLAGLINLEGSRRILRFYVRDKGLMKLCPLVIVPQDFVLPALS